MQNPRYKVRGDPETPDFMLRVCAIHSRIPAFPWEDTFGFRIWRRIELIVWQLNIHNR